MEYYCLKLKTTAFRAVRRIAVSSMVAATLLILLPFAPMLDPGGFGACGSGAALAAQDEGEESDLACEVERDYRWYLVCAKVTIRCEGDGFEFTAVLDKVCFWEKGELLDMLEQLGISVTL